MKPAKIIVISGVNGVGKTTLGFHLSQKLGIKQRVSLGTIVKTLLAFSDEIKQLELEKFDNHFMEVPNRDSFRLQCQIVSKAVNFIVNKYNKQGVDCIIEGVQLLRQYLKLPEGAVHVHLAVADHNKFRQQLDNSDTRDRTVNNLEFANLLALDLILRDEMSGNGVKILANSGTVADLVNKTMRYLRGSKVLYQS